MLLATCCWWQSHKTRDGRISKPAIRIRLDFHYLAKSDSGWIACFTTERIGANYCINISQTVCRLQTLVSVVDLAFGLLPVSSG